MFKSYLGKILDYIYKYIEQFCEALKGITEKYCKVLDPYDDYNINNDDIEMNNKEEINNLVDSNADKNKSITS